MIDELKDLFEYNRWANLRMLSAAGSLSPEALGRDMGSSFPSLLATLDHILSAEWIWLERWNGRSPAAKPTEWDLSTLEAIRSLWEGVQVRQAEFLDATTEDALRRPVEYRNTRGEAFVAPLGQLMRHVVNHSTYHRGQLTTMLRQLGYAAPATDLVLYHRDMAPAGSAAPDASPAPPVPQPGVRSS